MQEQYSAYPPYPVNRPYGPGGVAPVDPIISRLRPRDMVGILDQSFRVYRRHFLTFLAIIAVVHVPVNLIVQAINVAFQGTATDLRDSSSITSRQIESGEFSQTLVTIFVLAGALIIIGVAGGLLQYLSQGALTSAIADSYLDRPVTFGGAYRQMVAHMGPLLGLIGLQILIGLAAFVPPFLPLLLLLGAPDNPGAAGGAICLMFPLLFVAVIAYLYVNIRLTVIVPAVMVESLGPVQAMRRSWRLVEGYWWRTFALTIILGLMEWVVSIGPAGAVIGAVTLFTRNFDQVLIQALSGGITVLTTMFFVPLQLAAVTLYYFDLRVRKEGFDLETAMTSAYGQGSYSPGQTLPVGQASSYQYGPPALGYTQQPGYAPVAYGNPPAAQNPYQPYPAGPQQGYAPGPEYGAERPYEPAAPPSQDTVNLSAVTPQPYAETPAPTTPVQPDYTATPDWLARPAPESAAEPSPAEEPDEANTTGERAGTEGEGDTRSRPETSRGEHEG
jgi:hypothetical protein